MPKQPEEYIHRIGRTGRAGNQGNAVSLLSPKDWASLGLMALQRREVLSRPFPVWKAFKVFWPEKTKFSGKDAHPLAEAKLRQLKVNVHSIKNAAKGPVRKESKTDLREMRHKMWVTLTGLHLCARRHLPKLRMSKEIPITK